MSNGAPSAPKITRASGRSKSKDPRWIRFSRRARASSAKVRQVPVGSLIDVGVSGEDILDLVVVQTMAASNPRALEAVAPRSSGRIQGDEEGHGGPIDVRAEGAEVR